MTEAQPTSADPGRWIRFALVMLPVGTILLGIASFGIWQWKKDQAADRSFKYALALRRQISPEGIERYAGIVRTALGKTDRDLSIPGYLESTMGAENMGYTVRRERFGDEKSVVDAELTGTKRPLEVVMVLALYGGTEPQENTVQAIAESLSVAHELTGEKVVRSLRFAFIPDTPEALKQLKEGLQRDGERLSSESLAVTPGLGEVMQFIPLQQDGAEHKAFRMAVMKGMASRFIVALEPRVVEIANELIAELRPRGSCDFVAEFAEVLPINIFLSLVFYSKVIHDEGECE